MSCEDQHALLAALISLIAIVYKLVSFIDTRWGGKRGKGSAGKGGEREEV